MANFATQHSAIEDDAKIPAELADGTKGHFTPLQLSTGSTIPGLARGNRTFIKALDTTSITTAYLTEAGRDGFWKFESGNYAARVTADTAEGLYLAADGVATTSGAWVRSPVKNVDVRWFGITGSNDTAAFECALNVAAGRRIYVPADVTVQITSAITVATDVHLYGGGTIEVAFVGVGVTSTVGDVISDGITWDGDGQAISALFVTDADRCRLIRSTFTSFDSDTYVQAVTIIDAADLDVDSCEFSDLTALSDGTQGNTNGAIRAIYITGEVRSGCIQRSLFKNINNRDGSSNVTWEDADAIHTEPSSGKYQNIEVRKNRFENCGKRALKLVGLADSVYSIDRNTVESGWTGTTDDVGTLGNGMFYAFEAFGGAISCTFNRLVQGVALGLLALSTSVVQSAHIEGNVFRPEYHRYVNTIETRAFTGSGTLSATCPVTLVANTVANSWYACDRLGNFQTAENNDFTTYYLAFNDSGTRPVYRGNRLTYDAASAQVTNAINIKAGVLSFVVADNVILGAFQDAINIAAQSAAFVGVVAGNTIGAVTRNAIANFVGAAYEKYVVISNNKTDNTVNPSSYDASAYKWHINGTAVAALTTTGLDVIIPGYTAATIANIAATVNTTNKRTGQIISDTTNQRLMVSSGTTAASAWWVVDGSASVTPA